MINLIFIVSLYTNVNTVCVRFSCDWSVPAAHCIIHIFAYKMNLVHLHIKQAWYEGYEVVMYVAVHIIKRIHSPLFIHHWPVPTTDYLLNSMYADIEWREVNVIYLDLLYTMLCTDKNLSKARVFYSNNEIMGSI